MKIKIADETRNDDYSNIDSHGLDPPSGNLGFPDSRTDESDIFQECNDGDTNSTLDEDIKIDNDAQTPGIVDSPILDDQLDYRRITPVANLRERNTVLAIEREAKGNSLSLLNVKKQKIKDKFDLDNRAMIDRDQNVDVMWGKDRPTEHIKNRTGRIAAVKLAALQQYDRIKVADDIVEVQSLAKNGVISRNLWTGHDSLIEGSSFIRVSMSEPVKMKEDYPKEAKRELAYFEHEADKKNEMFDAEGKDERDELLDETKKEADIDYIEPKVGDKYQDLGYDEDGPTMIIEEITDTEIRCDIGEYEKNDFIDDIKSKRLVKI